MKSQEEDEIENIEHTFFASKNLKIQGRLVLYKEPMDETNDTTKKVSFISVSQQMLILCNAQKSKHQPQD